MAAGKEESGQGAILAFHTVATSRERSTQHSHTSSKFDLKSSSTIHLQYTKQGAQLLLPVLALHAACKGFFSRMLAGRQKIWKWLQSRSQLHARR